MESTAWPGSGLSAVLTMIWNGCWHPATIPPAAADVFLTEPEAGPYAQCATCAVVLPYRGGVWTNTATGGTWQGPLLYFGCCPCGGIDRQRAGPALRPTFIAAEPRNAAVDVQAVWESSAAAIKPVREITPAKGVSLLARPGTRRGAGRTQSIQRVYEVNIVRRLVIGIQFWTTLGI